jgi:hypothetical protein
MGSRTDANLAAFQEMTGIKPATRERAEILRRLQDTAFEAIKIIELERSGIRDGDGCWHGSDVVGGTISNLVSLCNQLNGIDGLAVYEGAQKPLTPEMKARLDEMFGEEIPFTD